MSDKVKLKSLTKLEDETWMGEDSNGDTFYAGIGGDLDDKTAEDIIRFAVENDDPQYEIHSDKDLMK